MSEHAISVGSPEEGGKMPPQAGTPTSTTNGDEHDITRGVLDASSSGQVHLGSGSLMDSQNTTPHRNGRNMSVGSFAEASVTEAIAQGTEPIKDAVGSISSEQHTPVTISSHKPSNMENGQSPAKTEPMLIAVQNGSTSVVRVIVDGSLFSPSRMRDNSPKNKGILGHDGNQYHCQVCNEFGDVVCCDGCPRVYHQKCIPPEDPSRKSLDNDEDPWYCPNCTGESKSNHSGRRADKGERKSSQQRCSDCQMRRSDLGLKPCSECGKYIHHPSCREEDDGSGKILCSTCRAFNALSREEMEAAGLNDAKSDDDDDDEPGDEGGTPNTKNKKKKKLSKKKKKKRKQEEKERNRAMMEATGTSRTRVAGLPQATPAFYFYLGENRWKVERVLAKKHRTFNRLPKGDERNALVAQEAAVWWTKLRSADQTRFINMSMKDYEDRIIAWKDEKHLNELGVILDDSHGPTDEELLQEDERMAHDLHDRLYQESSVGAKPFHPEPDESYNRLLVELLNDTRFHPLPLMGATKEVYHDASRSHPTAALPHFNVHGPISTGVGDECLGCSRGWAHFCTVLQQRIPANERRADLQPPVSSFTATRIGLGLRPPLEREEGSEVAEGNLFEWRDSAEQEAIGALKIIPSNSLAYPPDRMDDVVGLLEKVIFTKVPEPDIALLQASDGQHSSTTTTSHGSIYKCARCKSLVKVESGCVPCRRAQLVVSFANNNGSSKGNEDDKALKVQPAMLGKLNSREEGQTCTDRDRLVSEALLKQNWSPIAVLPASRPLSEVAHDFHHNREISGVAEVVRSGTDTGIGEEKFKPVDPPKYESNNNRPSRKLSVPAAVDFGNPVERQKVQELRKRDIDVMCGELLVTACHGILLACERRDPMGIFTDPVDIEGYTDVISNPMDFSTIRSKLSDNKYNSLSAFVTDMKLVFENAMVYNAEGSIHFELASTLNGILETANERGAKWMASVKETRLHMFAEEDSRERRSSLSPAPASESAMNAPFAFDPYDGLQRTWPEAADMARKGHWLSSAVGADINRDSENEIAYYGALAIRRVATAGEMSLAQYSDAGGKFDIVTRRTAERDDELRMLVDAQVAQVVRPGQLKDPPAWRDEAVAGILRKVQNRRLELQLASHSGCSRCDELVFSAEKKRLLSADATLPRKKRKTYGDLPRTDPARSHLTTGLASKHTHGDAGDNEALAGQPAVSVRPSRIMGLGLFADQNFKMGDIIAKPDQTAEQLDILTRRNGDNGLLHASTKHLKGGGVHFINHSCTPNCESTILQDQLCFVAVQDISINEELTYDYQQETEKDMTKRLPCNCHSLSCRGFLNWTIPERGYNHHALLTQRRPSSIKDRIKRLSRPSK